MSVTDETVSFSLEINVEAAHTDVRRLLTALNRTFMILRRMGLPEDVDKAMRVVSNLVTLLNQLRLTIIALEAASGPLGWWLALTGMASTQFAAANVVQGMNSR